MRKKNDKKRKKIQEEIKYKKYCTKGNTEIVTMSMYTKYANLCTQNMLTYVHKYTALLKYWNSNYVQIYNTLTNKMMNTYMRYRIIPNQ